MDTYESSADMIQQLILQLDQRVFVESERSNDLIEDGFLMRTWLEDSDSIFLEFITRNDFDNYKSSGIGYLAQISEGGENASEEYTLSLPMNLSYGELIGVIEQINKTISIDAFATVTNTLYTYLTKLIYRIYGTVTNIETKKTIAKELFTQAKKYGISEEMINNIVSLFDASFSKKRELIKVLGKKEERARINRDISITINNINSILSKSLDEVILKKGYQKIWKELMTISQLEQQKKIKEIVKDPNQVIYYRKQGKKIKLVEGNIIPIDATLYICDAAKFTKAGNNNTNIEHSFIVQPLGTFPDIIEYITDYIDIENMRSELDKVRKEGNQEKIDTLITKHINKLIEIIYKYPWGSDDNAYRINKFIENKAFSCLGASIILSCLLIYLGISHCGSDEDEHIAIKTRIGGLLYTLDPINHSNMMLVTEGPTIGSFTQGTVKADGETILYRLGNPEDIIMSSIWQNKGVHFYSLGEYQNAIECYNKAIEINPHNDNVWSNKGFIHLKLGEYQNAIECCDKAIEINPHNDTAWNNKGCIYRELGEYQNATLSFLIGYYLSKDENHKREFLTMYRKSNPPSKKYFDSLQRANKLPFPIKEKRSLKELFLQNKRYC